MQFQNFSRAAGCNPDEGLACLRVNASEGDLKAANNATVYPTPKGKFQYGPAIDHTFISDLPGVRLLNGSIYPDIDIMVGHNGFPLILLLINSSNEGVAFTPLIALRSQFDEWVRDTFLNPPEPFPQQVDDMYPSSNYSDQFLRLKTLLAGIFLA